MYLYTTQEARDWIASLRAASIEVLQYYNLPLDPGYKTRPWKHGHPIGVINHYTAGVTWKGTIQWLNGGSNHKSSCGMLVLDRRIGEVDPIISKYPELDNLPVLTLMLSSIDVATWHGGWTNSLCWGIEARNAGSLVGNQDEWYWWPKNWTTKFPHRKLSKLPVNIDGIWWEPYTQGQIEAIIVFCQYLHCLYQTFGGLKPSWFLPHSAVSKHKWDTGKAYPLQKIRDAVFDQTPVNELTWLQDFGTDPMYMDDYEEDEDAEFLRELEERQGVRDLPWGYEEYQQCVAPPPPLEFQNLIQGGMWRDELDNIRRGLSKLGYVVESGGPDLDEITAISVFQFQKSMGLVPDKVPGPITQKALYRRLKDFQLED